MKEKKKNLEKRGKKLPKVYPFFKNLFFLTFLLKNGKR
jgi:hypothetical protein